MLQWKLRGGEIYTGKKILRGRGEENFYRGKGSQQKKNPKPKNLPPPATTRKVKNPSFHLLCSGHPWNQDKPPPSTTFGLGKAEERTKAAPQQLPLTETSQGHTHINLQQRQPRPALCTEASHFLFTVSSSTQQRPAAVPFFLRPNTTAAPVVFFLVFSRPRSSSSPTHGSGHGRPADEPLNRSLSQQQRSVPWVDLPRVSSSRVPTRHQPRQLLLRSATIQTAASNGSVEPRRRKH